jgi:hypothetical protein
MELKPDRSRAISLEITEGGKQSVPVFTCIVYLRREDDGTVSGRVANLAEITASAASERELLSKLTREFKSCVRNLTEAGQVIPWIEPVQPRLENEQLRAIPVHL